MKAIRKLALLGSLTVVATATAAAGTAQASLPPQGLYEGCAPKSATMNCGQRLQNMGGAGFKYVLNYSAWYGSAAEVRNYADQAAAAGMQVIWPLNHTAWRNGAELADIYPGLAADCGCTSNDDFRDYAVNLVKDHPATWGFYVGDEQLPTAENVAKIKALSDQVKSIAPDKPTLFVTLPRTNLEAHLAPFLSAADVGGTDYYPVGLEADLSRFAGVASENRRVTRAHGKSPAMVLQAFSWQQYYPSTYPNARFPTRSEMQQMRDLAITHGQPSMVLWYAYHDVLESSDPAGNWANLKAAAFAPHIQVQGIPAKCSGKRVRLGVKVRSDSAMRQVRVLVDGKLKKRTARTRIGLSLRGISPGAHRVRVIATDRQGKNSKSSLKFRRCA